MSNAHFPSKETQISYKPVDSSSEGYLDKSNQSSAEPFEN